MYSEDPRFDCWPRIWLQRWCYLGLRSVVLLWSWGTA